MKRTIKIITIIIALSIYLPSFTIAQCDGDNTFNGSTDNDWSTAGNWSANCVPTTPILGTITIASDCEYSGSDGYIFNPGSALVIQTGITFNKSGGGSWTMHGDVTNEGTYIQTTLLCDGQYYGGGTFQGWMNFSGTMQPGDAPPPPWTCGDALSYEGQDYATVQIGNQCWMAENLNVGTTIDGSNNQTDNGIIEKYCYDDDVNNCDTYGGMYQWDEMMQYVTTESTQGICPSGWHLPSDDEFKTIEMELGMTQTQADGTGYRGTNQGSQMADNASLWFNGALKNDSDFGSSGFSGLPGGWKNSQFNNLHDRGIFWTSSEYNSLRAWVRHLNYNNTKVQRYTDPKTLASSIRCLKD